MNEEIKETTERAEYAVSEHNKGKKSKTDTQQAKITNEPVMSAKALHSA